MSLPSIKNVAPGLKVRFQSKRADDITNYVGTLLFVGNYAAIRMFTDPSAYNAVVRQSDPTVSSDPTTLTYFLLQIDNNAETPTQVPFADEWIASGTLFEVSTGNKIRIEVDDPYNNPQDIISLLASRKYACKIIS